MKKNAKLAPPPTSLRQVAVFLHNADFLRLRVTKPPPDSPTERCCFTLGTGNDLERSKFLINCGEDIGVWAGCEEDDVINLNVSIDTLLLLFASNILRSVLLRTE